MIIPHAERNPDYPDKGGPPIEEKSNRNFQIYKKPQKKFEKPKPPKKLKTRELFDFLNVWDCEIGKKHNYLQQFNQYLVQKKQTIELEEIEKKMKKPDFIKFFKYLKEQQSDSSEEEDEHEVNLQIAFTAKQRRDLNAQERTNKKKKNLPVVKPCDVLLPASFNPKFQVPQPSPDDFVIVTHFFNQYLEPPNKSLEKSMLCAYMLENRKFLQAYNINKNLLEFQLQEFPTQFEDNITLEEFINFILYPKILVIKDKYDQNLLKMVKGQLQFSDQDIAKLIKVYDEFNLDCEEHVNPLKLVNSLRTRYETKLMLFDSFLKFPDIHKEITFEKWLYEFEVYSIKTELQYISRIYFKEWQNQLFEIPSKFVVLQSSKLSKRKKFDKLYENEEIVLPSSFFSQLEKIFSQTRKVYERFAQKKHVVDNILANQDFMHQYEKQKVRKEKTNQLPIETVEETLNRILLESQEYIDQDELIDFFTVRGRPLELNFKLKQQYQVTKKKQIQDNPKEFGAINKIDDGFFLITIPNTVKDENKPKTIRQKEVEKMLIEKEKDILKEINTKFHASSVPWYVKEPLYDQLNREREERRERIKEESKAKLMQSMMEPKSFEKQKKEYHIEPEIEFKYMSRPVPLSTTEPKFQMIMESLKARSKSNVEKKKAEWADYFANQEQLQKQQEREEIQKAKKKIQNKLAYQPEKFEKFRAKSLPNFERLHAIFENIMAAKKKGFVPTQPCQTNLTTTNRTVDCSMLDLGNQSTLKSKEKLADIDNKLDKILKSERPNIIKTKASSAIGSLRRKQRYEKEQKQKRIEDELQGWKDERKQLLPKNIKIQDAAADQQKILDKELEDLVRWKKKYHKNLDKDYEEDLRKMQKRVQKRQLLRFQKNGEDEEVSDSQSSKSSDKDHRINNIDKFL